MEPYPSWTTCKPIAGIDEFNVWSASTIFAVVAAIVAVIAFAIASLSVGLTNPVTLAIAAGALAIAATAAAVKVKALRDYFLHGRLACIADSVCALGRIFSLEDDADGDKALNLVLGPATEDHTEDEYRAMFQAEELIYPDPGVETHGWEHDPHSNTKWLRDEGNDQQADFGENKLPLFHCEIEGTDLVDYLERIYAWLITVAIIAAAVAVAAAALAALGPIGWAILGLLILLTIIFGTLVNTDDDLTESVPADAPEIDVALPTEDGPVLIVNDDNTSLRRGDIIILFGRHICDTAHAKDWGTWNEIHPVFGILKANRPQPVDPEVEDPAEILYSSVAQNRADDVVLAKYCGALESVFDPSSRRDEASLEHAKLG